MGLRMFCEIGIPLRLRQNLKLSKNIFGEFEVGLRIFLSEEKKEVKLDLEIFLSKKGKGERELNLRKFVQVKGKRRVK